ncbi:MAG: sigma-70 family RNA polymerase sigma factor [Dehalococcoidia bacterium]|nr:MAG: sigma-70 family RNA polymerase sigma factor [Dehalococcoidia bacterium]
MTDPANAASGGPATVRGATSDPAVDALVTRARAGDMTAFNTLVLRFQDGVYGLTLRMLGDPAAAEDATQDAFIRAWQRLETYRGGSFRAWLFTIAANRARDELRRHSRRPTRSLDEARDDPDHADIDPPDSAPTAHEVLEQSELRQALEAALRALPDDWREVVVLADVQGLDYVEVAAVTGVAVGTVKSRLSRARGRLREVIRNSPELFEAAGRLTDRR